MDIDRLHAELKEYKVVKNYGNVFISRESLQGILADRCELRMLKEDAQDPEKMHRAASRALKTYLDKFVRLCERRRRAHTQNQGYWSRTVRLPTSIASGFTLRGPGKSSPKI